MNKCEKNKRKINNNKKRTKQQQQNVFWALYRNYLMSKN